MLIEKINVSSKNNMNPLSQRNAELSGSASGTTTSVRRPRRVTGRVNYSEILSPVGGSLIERNTLLSTYKEQNEECLGQEDVDNGNLVSGKKCQSKSCEEKSPRKQGKTIASNSKYFHLISESENVYDLDKNLIVAGKGQRKPKIIYSPDSSSNTPSRIHKEQNTPKSEETRSKLLANSESKNDYDLDINLIVTGKRQIKPKIMYSPDSSSNTPSHIHKEQNTPKSVKTRLKFLENTPKSVQRGTTVNRTRLLRSGAITPSMQDRNKASVSQSTPLTKARSQLHVCHIPKALPCREKEYLDIYNFIEGKLSDCCGGCMYVSGVPGTGKTATVTSVINNLLSSVESGDVPNFEFVNVNGMKLTEPRQAYVEILKQLTASNKTVPWEQAQSILEDKFTKYKKDKTPVVLLVDELDILCTKRQDVVYTLLDWPTKAKRQLIVITIANMMDLPERLLLSRVASRLGLTRLTFQAYTHKQLQEIVTKRLTGTNSFNPDAIQLVARKVASVSGDARRALDICRRAAEFAELEGPNTYVTMLHVNEALNAMITQPKVQAIKRCSRLEQLILQSVVAENERTGVEETVFCNILKMLTSIFAIHGFQPVSSGIILAAVNRLCACRLLITDQKSSDINQRIILNVSNDDVYYALRKD